MKTEITVIVNGAEALVIKLHELGIKNIFGVTGGASLELFDKLGDIGPKYGIVIKRWF